jgi:cytochrome c-type biogenesis protein CcmF
LESELLSQLPVAQPWSLWVGTVGKALVLAGLGLFILSVVGWALAARRPRFERIGGIAFILGCVAMFATMGCLIALFVANQFQYEYIFARGAADTALKYKVAGVWSGQQGSFLLWGCASALFGLLAMAGTGPYRRWYTITFGVFLGALCGILAYETPFNLMNEVQAHGAVLVPPTGVGMTPALQNYWVVIHPPVIFLGFGALTILFAYAVAAMMTGDLKGWAPRARPWSLVSLAVLGLGVCMGGFWAYETLGWGGFWAWDPVENVSLVPWIVNAALVHGIIVQVARDRWFGANLWLAGMPFMLFVYGTFLTRSGLLTEVSVHSFAQMDANALKVLVGFLVATVLTFTGLYLVKGRPAVAAAQPRPEVQGASRESLYRFGMLMLCLLAFVIAIGMSWPVILGLINRPLSVVEERLYHQVVTWFFVPIMLLMAITPFVGWRKLTLRALLVRMVNVVSVTVGLLGLSLLILRNPQWGVQARPDATVPGLFGFHLALLPWMMFLLFLCLFVAVANLWRAVELARRSRSSLGGFTAHFGLAMLLAGLILSRGFEHKEQVIVPADRAVRALDYVISFEGVTDEKLKDRDGKVRFAVAGERDRFVARPGLYYYPSNDGEKAQVWPHIQRQLSHDVYFTLHPPAFAHWEEPEWLKVGESTEHKGVHVTYLEPTTEGEPGIEGTRFGARLKIKFDGQEFNAHPAIVIGQGPELVRLNEEAAVVLARMEASDRSVAVQMLYAVPMFPVELYYKPMTILVWIGTGILTLGGLMSAFFRRRRTAEAVPAAD